MRLIDYAGYYKKLSPRSTIKFLVMEAVFTGFFLGLSLIEVVRGRNFWTWAWMLAMVFSFGVGTLQATLVALHNCPPSTKALTDKTVPHNAGA
jgi:hypothetical protein